MSLISSMYSASAGLNAHGDALSTIGQNIANVNTAGYKSATPRFVDVMASAGGMSALTSTPNGQGARLKGTEQNFSDGALLATGVVTDLALSGRGFFVVKAPAQTGGLQAYTRAGQFHLDQSGYLESYDGLRVQGFSADSTGALTSTVGDLQIRTDTLISPAATAKITMNANLAPTPPPKPAWDATNPATTSTFSATQAVFDSLGQQHTVEIYFVHTGGNTYDWHALVDGGDLTVNTPGVGVEQANGNLTFDLNGKLTSMSTLTSSFNFKNATQGQVIQFNFGDPTSLGGSGTSGITNYAMSGGIVGNVNSNEADGYGTGQFGSFAIDDSGVITATYSNGKLLTLGQVAVAKFPSQDNMSRLGDTLYGETNASGAPIIGIAKIGGRGSISAQSLEQSNSDLSRDFIALLSYQRGFQANTRTVHTADAMMQELVNLGR